MHSAHCPTAKTQEVKHLVQYCVSQAYTASLNETTTTLLFQFSLQKKILLTVDCNIKCVYKK